MVLMNATHQAAGDLMAEHLTEVRRLANEHEAALAALKEAAAEAAADQAGVTRSTMYAWLCP